MGLGEVSVLRLCFGLFFIVLMGCGRTPTPEEKQEFTPYLQRFVQHSNQRGRPVSGDLNIVYGSFKGSHLGMCDEGWLRSSHVEINRDAWRTASEPTREMMLFHELGHCLLGRSHLDEEANLKNYRIPASVMNTHGVSGSLYQRFQNYYLNELFSGG